MWRLLVPLLWVLGLMLSSFSVAALPLSKDDFRNVMQAYFSDAEKMRALALNQGLTQPESQDLAIEFYRTVLGDERYLDITYDQMAQLGMFPAKTDSPDEREQKLGQLAQFSAYQVQTLMSRGMRRLSLAKQRETAGYALENFKRMRDQKRYSFCRAQALGDYSRLQRKDIVSLNRFVFSFQSTRRIARLFALTKEAVLAELDDNPAPRKLTVQERDLVEQGLGKYLDDLSEGLDEAETDRLVAAMEDMQHAADQDVCDVTVMLHEALLSRTGLLGELSVRYIYDNE